MALHELSDELCLLKTFDFRRRFGDAHYYLACHAALPMALTPDLVYRLWANFQRDNSGNILQIPWIAVSDLLLSGLCEEVSYETYEMHPTIRKILLNDLKKSSHFGAERVTQLANFLIDYVKHYFNSLDIEKQDFSQAQLWTALAYVNPEESAHNLAKKLEQLSLEERTEWVRISALIDALAEPLVESGFEPLVTYAKAMSYLAKGDAVRAAVTFEALPIENNKLEIAGVQLFIPDIQQEEMRMLPPVPPLHSTNFEIARLEKLNSRQDKRWEIASHSGQAQCFLEDLDAVVNMTLISIPGNQFEMGKAETTYETERESPLHQVTVAPFFLGQYLVTQQQWQAVAQMEKIRRDLDPNPSRFKGEHLPVERILWREAIEFCERLRQYTGKPYRLPTEAEWEYACRAGTITAFCFGGTILPELACYDGSTTVDVGSYNFSNAFGLYDMHGNVWEWCMDHWHENYEGAPSDGTAWLSDDQNQYRVIRGGSWIDEPKYCRSAYRNGVAPTNKLLSIGLRVAVSFEDSGNTVN